MLVFRSEIAAADRLGATDANCTRIASIDAFDSLGYPGCGREEHSGENAPVAGDAFGSGLADNRARQLGRDGRREL